MSTYEALHNESDEGSVASSVGAPPFALGANEENDLHLSVVELEEPSCKNLQSSGTTLPHSIPDLAASHAMSSVSTAQGQRSSITMNSSSRGSLPHHSQQHHDDDGMETYVFDTSNSMLGSSSQPPSLLGSSHLPGSGTLWTHDSTGGGGSLDFSQLMRRADDQHQHHSSTLIVQSRMPTLIEKEEGMIDSGQTPASTDSSNVTPQTNTNQYSSGGNNWLSSLFYGSPSPEQQLHAVPLMSLSPSYLDAGGLSGAGRDIQATRLGENTFQVSMQIDPPSTVRDVMGVLGNADLLRLWCDPIRTLIVTKSSEGAQSATNRGGSPGDSNREYEGEWIEATTSTLVSPSKHSSCLYTLGQLMYTSLGFPSYGKITLFVERLRGQVGLTIGPFAGGIVASHTIKVQDDGPVVSVVDNVRLSRDEESCVCCCGLCEPIKRCFLPRMAGHVEQAMSSFLRLRILIEHGETGSYAASPGVGYDVEEGVSSIPLLS